MCVSGPSERGTLKAYSTCLGQVYQDKRRGTSARGYARNLDNVDQASRLRKTSYAWPLKGLQQPEAEGHVVDMNLGALVQCEMAMQGFL